MRLQELKKQMWKQSTLWGKMQTILLRIYWTVQEKWWLLTGTCPHEATIGGINAKKVKCLLCGKIIKNEI